MGAHELLERRHLVGVRVIHAVDEYVRAVGEAIVAAQMVGRRRVEVRERVLALDACRPPGAGGPPPPITSAPCACERTITNPIPGWAAESVEQSRMRLGDLLERQPLGAQRQIDEPEAAGDEHHRLLAPRALSAGALALGQGLAVRSQRDGALDRSAARGARQHAPADAGLLARVGQHRADVAPGLVDRGRGVHLAARERPVHDLLERLAVALAERRALRLAVVGEHDEVIRARRLRRRTLQPGELVIVSLEHRERIGLANPRVVGDLVIADERRVADRHALDDVGHQQRDVMRSRMTTAIVARMSG